MRPLLPAPLEKLILALLACCPLFDQLLAFGVACNSVWYRISCKAVLLARHYISARQCISINCVLYLSCAIHTHHALYSRYAPHSLKMFCSEPGTVCLQSTAPLLDAASHCCYANTTYNTHGSAHIDYITHFFIVVGIFYLRTFTRHSLFATHSRRSPPYTSVQILPTRCLADLVSR